MSKGIKISEKYGLNPTMPICFWCEQKKNEVALLGKLKGDVEAPKEMWIPGDYEPCDNCKKLWDSGIVLIEASENPIYDEKQPAFHGAYPSGRFIVMTEKGVREIFDSNTAESVIERKMGFMDQRTMEALQKIFEEAKE